jgi:tetratricopeptide (TPR) repeat protein
MRRISLLVIILAVAVAAVAGCGGKAGTGDAVSRGVQLFEAGDYDAAKEYYQAELAATPDNAEAEFYLGRIALAQQRHDDALARLQHTVELAPENSNYYYWLGIAYAGKVNATQDFMEKGQLAPKMKEAAEKAVELDPDNLDARQFLAQYLFNAPPIVGGSEEKGMEQVEEIKSRDPKRGHLFAARMYLARKDFNQAEVEIKEAVKVAPDDPDVHYQLGRFYQDTEDYINAFAAFEKALEADADHMGALYQVGRTAVFSGVQLERGIACLEKYLKGEPGPSEPTRAHAHWRLGMIYEKQGDTDRARAEYEKALELNPDIEQAKEALDALE